MELRAYGKINLILDVVRRREDGYHEVRMIMQTVGIYDTLQLERSARPGIRLTVENSPLSGDEKNLAYRAAALLMEEFKIKEGLDITLTKRIPMAAGMAGGSSDAAAVLRGVNECFGLGLTLKELQEYGVRLGADIPYCLAGGTQLSEGIGEILTREPAMPDCYIVLAKPAADISTKYVYENLHANELKFHPPVNEMLKDLERGDLRGLSGRLGNVLENVTLTLCPEIGRIKEMLLSQGALGSLMSGSGPTVFGIFEDRKKAEEAYERLKRELPETESFLTEPVREI